MTGEAADLARFFRNMHEHWPRIFRAPGRVNLIGEHTDYNEGFVMPAAIDFAARVAVGPRDDRRIQVYSRDFGESITFDADEEYPVARRHWSDYVRGVAVMIARAGHRVSGANLVVDSDVPIGSGLSSSAALEVATALALLANSGLSMDKTEVALLCQRAENEFVGARSGIMDQFISCYGREGHALRLDCRSLERFYVPVPATVRLAICDTMVKHSLASNEYNQRREECESGVKVLSGILPGIHALRDVSLAGLTENEGALDPVIYRRCRHVVTENARVLKASEALEHSDMRRFGGLMVESHNSLRDDYEVSCRELDVMVALALGMEGVFGARMTGGGFGGCTINVVEASRAEAFANAVIARYTAETGNKGAYYISSAQEGVFEERQVENAG